MRHELTDEFLGAVAACYRTSVSERQHPDVSIACKYHVPVATARRWVYEARRRGVMPAGRQGSADDWDGRSVLTAAMRLAIETALETGDLSALRREYWRL